MSGTTRNGSQQSEMAEHQIFPVLDVDTMNSSLPSNVVGAKATVDRIPVTLLTGFLGAGKTTLLNHWVNQPEMAGVAVLVNEFGEVGIDHHLVDALNNQMILLDSGCMCCSVQGDLVAALRQLSDRVAKREIAPISRVVIETTGLADPVPVLYTLMEEPFVCARYVCDAVVTVVSATQGLKQLEQHPESQRQVVAADRLLISKCDLSSSDEKERLEHAVRALNPHATMVAVRRGISDIDGLLAPGGVYGRADVDAHLQTWLGSQVARHSTSGLFGYLHPSDRPMDSVADSSDQYLGAAHRNRKHSVQPHSFVVTFDWPVAWLGFSFAMGRILRSYGADLLRIKGLMRVARDETHPRVVQCVQGIAYPPVRLQYWPLDGAFEDGCGRLVFITRKSDKDLEAAIRSALNEQGTDAAALRACATDWSMPTRCWMSQRIPIQVSNGMVHAAWDIQKRRFRSGSSV